MTKRITPKAGVRILELCKEGVSYRAIAEEIDSTHTAVQSWIKRNSERQKQAVTDGQIEMLPAPEIVGNQRTRGKKRGTGNYQTILAQEKIRALQIANDTAEGRLIPTGDVEITWAKKLGALKTSLEALPARLKQRRPELVGDDIDSVRELLSESIREALAA